jgi:hypothetical protein
MVNENKRKIYLVVSQTGTILSRIVKYVTRDKYNHVSLALDKDLSSLYSFGRKKPYNPFVAGFVKESPTTGTFGRFKKTVAVVLEVEVEEEIYRSMEDELTCMYEHRNEYHYNYMGLITAFFGKLRPKKNTYYCSEFVQMFLRKYGLGLKKGEKELVCPNDFVNVDGGKIIYTGVLMNYAEALLKSENTEPVSSET